MKIEISSSIQNLCVSLSKFNSSCCLSYKYTSSNMKIESHFDFSDKLSKFRLECVPDYEIYDEKWFEAAQYLIRVGRATGEPCLVREVAVENDERHSFPLPSSSCYLRLSSFDISPVISRHSSKPFLESGRSLSLSPGRVAFHLPDSSVLSSIDILLRSAALSLSFLSFAHPPRRQAVVFPFRLGLE